MKKHTIILALIAAGLTLATYLSSKAPAGSCGACSALTTLAPAPSTSSTP